MKYYLAIDLGATSGRHIVGHQENGELILDEIYRFKTGYEKGPAYLYWDTERFLTEIKAGIKVAFEKYGKIESLAIDTWGVDYALLNNDTTIYPVFCYRDDRTIKSAELVHNIIPFNELYKHDGLQFAPYNTIYQLYDDKMRGRLNMATDFLCLPNYFTYLLTGVKLKEYTIESTGGLLNVNTKQYDEEIIEKLDFPKHLFKNVVPSGTIAGPLKDEIAKEVGGNTTVKLCPSHDTASAFEAVDFPEDAIFVSSGTWSLIGTKIKEASISEESSKSNFANEGGVGYFRYLKNIMGMYLVNEIQRKDGLHIKEIEKIASESGYKETFDVANQKLNAPEDMEQTIIEILKEEGKPLPKTHADVYSSIYYSLALSYDKAVKNISKNLDKKFNSIYIVGGGAKNLFMNKLVEETTGLKVVALPIEATVIGNIKSQMK